MPLGRCRHWRVGFGHDEDRTRRVIQDGASHASNEQRPKAAPAVRANVDEVCVPVHGRFDEPVCGAAVFHAALGLEAGFVQSGRSLPGEGFVLLMQFGGTGRVRFPESVAAQPGIPLWVDVGDAEDPDARPVENRPATNGVRGRCGTGRAVLAEQDAGDAISPGDENRYEAVVDDLGGDRTQDGRLERSAAAVAQNDEIGVKR